MDDLRNRLKEALAAMPLVQMAQGRADYGNWGRENVLKALMAQKVGPDAESAYEAALNVGPMMMGKIVYHGSPHKFDKFDASKIGTGEGAQAYGHGVYLADAPEVAKGYAESLGKPVRTIDGRPKKAGDLRDELSDLVGNFGPDVAREHLTNYLESSVKYSGAKGKQYQDGIRKQLQMLDAGDFGKAENSHTGALYKADLPDEWIPKMLDWDKPINEAQRVPLSKAMMEKFGSGASQSNGEQILKSLAWEFKNAGSKNPQADAAKFMRENGIPGIRYLDGGSRGKGQGSYNYVVFPGLEDQVKILERNGEPVNAIAEALMRRRSP